MFSVNTFDKYTFIYIISTNSFWFTAIVEDPSRDIPVESAVLQIFHFSGDEVKLKSVSGLR